MKQLLAAAVMALFPLALTAQSAHFKTTQSGASASVALNPDQFTQLNLQVARGSINGVANTHIVFIDAVFAQDFQSLTFTQIFGPIPDSAFSGDNVQGLHLNLDTSTLDPTVTFSETCMLDLNTFIFTCGPATPGLIQVDFVGNSAMSTQVITSETVQTIGPDTIRTHQSSTNTSANAQGSILGVAIATSGATIALNKNSAIEVTRF
jgi:hypothetical protein